VPDALRGRGRDRRKEFATKQIHVWRLEEGKLIEHWSVRDDLGQALQLGLLD
jgi:hypothetical protein